MKAYLLIALMTLGHYGRVPMQKLIEKYQVAPTAKLAARIKAYDHKHPFSAMFLNAEQTSILARILGA
jgi:hypothetical protein